MIYFDNAATSRPKPDCVINAFEYYIREVGTSPGRGSYELGIQASRMLFQARKTVASFFGVSNPDNIVFTKNSTEAINFFFNGFLKEGDHVIISPFEHNAVLRPLHTLKENGVIDYSVLPEDVLYDRKSDLSKYIKPNTVLLVLTLASNLTGQLVFSKGLAAAAKQLGIPVFVDASQGAGKKIINMSSDNVDYLAFTGHKDLLALPGVGGFISSQQLKIRPLLQGGTGIHGESYVNPQVFPDSYEAGTLNMPAIWSLKASLDFIDDHIDVITQKEVRLVSSCISGIKRIPSITLYRPNLPRVSTFCFNINDVPSSIVVEKLSKMGICVRGGIHCAIKAHETLGTEKTGAVRVSLNYCNSENEVEQFLSAIREIQ